MHYCPWFCVLRLKINIIGIINKQINGPKILVKYWNFLPHPHAFLIKQRGYCNRPRLSVRPSVRPSVRLSVMLSPPKTFTKFNQIWCVSFSHKWGVQQQKKLAPPPGALGRGQKVKYHLISITKSISKIFIPNFVFTNEKYKTYQTGFNSVAWVMP